MTKPVLLEFSTVERKCGGTVELFHVEQDLILPYRLRFTAPSGNKYAVAMRDAPVAKAVMKNWVRGEAIPPWAHLVDGNWGME